ncbi:DUF4350 domain-containing protein [Croceivirga thetidis]|uniref:DUF4350 domain-containing protein n=1 Tax=Croceivirga thetidis TaxID=2721623 RepID=A0ABX1GQK7_9FLAO|nr:DUF4350 domain-containing protein [Croceivirga thetidis]NKI31879.1 DUF4350 domain-containing protein [Croceivirga thetidis]
MERRAKIILWIFGLVLLGIIASEIIRPRPLDWRPSYTLNDKIPFGCYVLHNELPTIFPNSQIETIEESLYDVLIALDSTEKSNYMLINDFVDLDQQELNQLLSFVEKGNSVFLSTNSISYNLADTLNLVIRSDYTITEDTVLVDLTHQKFKGQKFSFARGLNNTQITKVDTANTTILGYLEFLRKNEFVPEPAEKIKLPNFIKTKFGRGDIFIHSTPQAFANYYLLGGNSDYAANVLSYIDTDKIFWDNYKKSGRVIIDSPMRFVLNQDALKWAYYLMIIGLLLFVIFRAKREQRIIPVIEPIQNSSVEFARTVGSLYYQSKDYNDLIEKKLNYFLAFLRERYYIDTTTINENTFKVIASKSAKPYEEVKKLMEFIIYLKGKPINSEQDLIQLNKKITAFKS